ncbi:MAG: NAD(+) diphosphatase, partial [Micrococcales bacterium]
SRLDPDLFDHLWENPLTRVLVLFEGKTLLQGSVGGFAPVLRLLEVEQVPSAQLRVYLGKTLADEAGVAVDSPVVLAVLSKNSADQIEPDANAWVGLRNTGVGLSDRDSGLYAQALALANWHESHAYCPRCGLPTVIQEGGWSRRCFSDNSQVFPRTDPAVIMSVIDQEDRILLGSQGSWEENRFSLLAGFVEPGESLAAAVIREVFEEAGIVVEEPEYLASQSWPFPYSLMCGFTAKVRDSHAQALQPDGIEIVKLRWFSRTQLAQAVANREITLPGRLAIARAIIEHWYGEEIIEPNEGNQ